jgi:hypothetical protein
MAFKRETGINAGDCNWNQIGTKFYTPLFPTGGKPLKELPKKYISSKSHRE